MANTIEVKPNEAVKIPQQKNDWAERAAKADNIKQPDQINYDLAPLEGPVIYLTHNVSD